ncbi:MAG: alpha/beta hydrolase fold domain-containing protein [Saccharofermentanales bacterium]
MKLLKIVAKATGFLLGAILLTGISYCVFRGFNPFSLIHEPVADNTPAVFEYKEADGEPLVIHFYEPTRRLFRKAPLVVYIHGGAWEQGTHVLGEDELAIVNPMRDYGVAVASVQYRLTDEENKFPDHINDVTDAIRYLTANARDLGIDKKRIAELGGSAGAHLSLLAAFAQDEFHDAPALADIRYEIRCIVSLSTPCDLVDLSCYEGEDLVRIQELLTNFLGYPYEQNPAIYIKASPVTYIRRDKTPIFLAHGEKDAVVPVIQADNYYAKATAAGMDIEYIRVLNGKHGLGSADGGPTTPPKDELLKRLIYFVLKNLLV